MIKIFIIFTPLLLVLLSGCATVGGTNEVSQEFIKEFSEKRASLPLNPKYNDVIWQNLKIGMTAEEVLRVMPNSKFDDQWNSGGMVTVMSEAGIFANNKIKVNAEIDGPFKTKSNLYILFDQAGRLDGIIIATLKNQLPENVMRLYGSIGFNLMEYKEAAKIIIGDFAIPELGKRKGPPRFGREQLDSFGSIGVAQTIGSNRAIGVGIPTGSISPSTIIQTYEKDGYKSLLSIRTLYLGLYNVYSAPLVFFFIQAKEENEKIEDF